MPKNHPAAHGGAEGRRGALRESG